jgi:hypothetical protein
MARSARRRSSRSLLARLSASARLLSDTRVLSNGSRKIEAWLPTKEKPGLHGLEPPDPQSGSQRDAPTQILRPPTIAVHNATLDEGRVDTVRGVSCAPVLRFDPYPKPVAELAVDRLGYDALMRGDADCTGSYRNRNGPVAPVLPLTSIEVNFLMQAFKIQCDWLH